MIQTNKRLRRRADREGGAVVEAALILPVLIILMLGVIDIAQYINLAQVVSNASREAARVAARTETDSFSEVQTAAVSYLSDMFPNVSESEMSEAVVLEIRDANGNSITDLSSVESGAQLSAYLKFDFKTIRWLAGVDYWSGSSDQSSTVFRRE